MAQLQKISPCLWFDRQGEEAAKFWVSIFPDSRIVSVILYGQSDHDPHRDRAGSVMVVAFELAGQSFAALNGGPQFTFSEAVSFQVACEDQAEVDYYWERLSEGGDPRAQQCGWLKDRFGVSWQVVPRVLLEMLQTGEAEQVQRLMDALFPMQKLDMATLVRAFEG